MGMVRCGMGEICGEGHGTSSAHMQFMSEKEMEAVDKELEEMEAARIAEDMMREYYFEDGEYYLRRGQSNKLC